MSVRRSLACLASVLLLLAGARLATTPQARADTPSCAQTVTTTLTSPSTPLAGPGVAPNPPAGAPSAGNPCWTDVLPYPFGSDGNPVDPTESLCGASWTTSIGDFNPAGLVAGLPTGGEPPCYLQVNSLAFRAWNRGLAATGIPSYAAGGGSGASGTVAYGVWLYNGTDWFPDPTFPGSNVCPGSTILWAGKLDYWLVGSSASPQKTLCRFDGVNLQWEPLSLPAATVARLPLDANGKPTGGITSGACYAWNNCWFFGDDGIQVHWDGQSLSDATPGSGTSPWLQGDATAAVAGTDPSGNPFGVAVAKSSRLGNSGTVTSPTTPNGSPPAQLFGSQGGPWAPVPYTSPKPVQAQLNDPYATDLTQVSADAQGDVWIAGDPASRLSVPPEKDTENEPAPLQRLTESGVSAPCPGYGADAFTSEPNSGYDPGGFGYIHAFSGYTWSGLSVGPDGSALAGAAYANSAIRWPANILGQNESFFDSEPALVHAVCGQPPTVTEFRRLDPMHATQVNDPLIPADYAGWATAVAANAPNDAWAATSDGVWGDQLLLRGTLAPHLYHWTDGPGQTPDAPAGDDNETRPSLFTLDPPVYAVGQPTVVVTPVTVTTTHRGGRSKQVKLKPAIYGIHSKLQHSLNGTFTLYLTFRVRRAVTVGLEALHGSKVVASTGLKHFTGHTGKLALRLNRQHWPTRVRLVTPKPPKKKPSK